MPDLNSIAYTLACGFAAMVALGFVTWVVSFVKTDVSIVDSVWSLLIFSGGAA